MVVVDWFFGSPGIDEEVSVEVMETIESVPDCEQFGRYRRSAKCTNRIDAIRTKPGSTRARCVDDVNWLLLIACVEDETVSLHWWNDIDTVRSKPIPMGCC